MPNPMNRDKQIEEMDTVLRAYLETSYVYKVEYAHYGGFDYHKAVFTEDIAKALYDAGYRKASEVAGEIAEEILDVANVHGAGVMFWHKMQKFADALKKKYTEGEG